MISHPFQCEALTRTSYRMVICFLLDVINKVLSNLMRSCYFQRSSLLMKRFTFALTGAMAVMLMAPHAQAQCPLGALAGTWIFSVDGFQVPAFQFLSSAGRFVATVGTDRAGNPQG